VEKWRDSPACGASDRTAVPTPWIGTVVPTPASHEEDLSPLLHFLRGLAVHRRAPVVAVFTVS
jgi:hypothetical protein